MKRNDHSGERKQARLPKIASVLGGRFSAPICQCLFSYDTTSITGSLGVRKQMRPLCNDLQLGSWVNFELIVALKLHYLDVGKNDLNDRKVIE